jgi:hypothetical protein
MSVCISPPFTQVRIRRPNSRAAASLWVGRKEADGAGGSGTYGGGKTDTRADRSTAGDVRAARITFSAT